jgi:hypothetical protein
LSDIPPEPPAWTPPAEPPHRTGRTILVGALLGVLALMVVFVLLIFVIGPVFPDAWLLGLPLILVAYLVTSIVLAVRPKTGALGGGLLIGLGVFVLLGAGTCVALLTGIGAATA